MKYAVLFTIGLLGISANVLADDMGRMSRIDEQCSAKGIESFDRKGSVHVSGYSLIDSSLGLSRSDYCKCAENYARWIIKSSGRSYGGTASCQKTRYSGSAVYKADVFIAR